MTSRPSIGRARIGLLNTMLSASSSLTWAGVGLPDSRSLRKGCIVISPMQCPFAAESGPRLRLGLCRHGNLVVAGLNSFQGVRKPFLQLSLAGDPKKCANQSALEVLA